jgi:hypothetical protein
MASAETSVAALTSFVGRVGDADVIVLQGEVRQSSDSVVRKFPALFGPAPAAIEQATAAPGERRATRLPTIRRPKPAKPTKPAPVVEAPKGHPITTSEIEKRG